MEEERDEKQDYYLAQIAAEVRRSYVKQWKTVKTKDFLIKMVRKEQGTKVGSKQAWAMHLNIDLEKN